MAQRICEVATCVGVPTRSRYCDAHYQRLYKRGTLDEHIPVRVHRLEMGQCCLLGCNKPAAYAAEQWCSMHYQRYRKHGDPLWERPERACRLEGCGTSVKGGGRGWCRLHYGRVLRDGEPGSIASSKAPPGKGRNVARSGYVQISVLRPSGRRRYRQMPEHRWVLEQYLGRPLEEWENIHHINGVRHDNRLENLEVWVTPQPAGQRLDQMLDWWVEHYPEALQAALDRRGQLRLVI